jgi:hypothetical protein
MRSGVLRFATYVSVSCVMVLAACVRAEWRDANLAFDSIVTGVCAADVEELEVTGDGWMGYEVFMRFRAEAAVIERLLSAGHYSPAEEVKWSSLERRYREYKPLSRGWGVSELQSPAFFVSTQSLDPKRPCNHCVAIDAESGLVLFYGWRA